MKGQLNKFEALDDEGKADLNSGYRNPQRKLEVTTHFSEIISL